MKRNPLAYQLNTYFSMLIVTVIGAGAALIIVHVGTSATMFAAQSGAQSVLYNAVGP